MTSTSPRRPAPVWAKISLVAVSLLLMEGAARFWVHVLAPGPLQRKYAVFEDLPAAEKRVNPHPYLCYTNTADYRRDGGELSHNSLGWRGPETPLKKPPGVFRVAVIGGSTVYTEAVGDNRQTFPAHLQRLMRAQLDRPDIEVINAGVPGYNSWESLGNLCFRVLEMEPDLVIVYHGTNDAHCRMVRPESYRADNRGRRRAWSYPKLSWLETNSTLYRILKRLKLGTHIGLEPFNDAPDYHGPYSVFDDPDREFNELLDRNPPLHFRNNLRNMIAICREHDVRIMLASWAWTNQFPGDYSSFAFYQRAFRELNETARALATEKSVPFYDFAAEMPMDRSYWGDGRHVNAKGSLLKAELFARFLGGSSLLDKR